MYQPVDPSGEAARFLRVAAQSGPALTVPQTLLVARERPELPRPGSSLSLSSPQLFLALAAGTFSLLRPGEPYFLQFTPLLQDVNALLTRLFRTRNAQLPHFGELMRTELQSLQGRKRGNGDTENPLAALLEENRGEEWVLITPALQPGETGETGETEKKNGETGDKKPVEQRTERDETPSNPNETPTQPNETPTSSLETPVDFDLESDWSNLLTQNRVSTRPFLSASLIRLLWDQIHQTFNIPAGSESIIFRSDPSKGVSQLLDSARGVENTLLVVGTSFGDVIGAFQSESWRYSAVFYTSGNSGVFRCRWKEGWSVEWFGWSKANAFCRVSTERGIAVGVGNRHALLLSADLKNGASGECSTYRSPPLCDLSEFGCDVVELWTCQ